MEASRLQPQAPVAPAHISQGLGPHEPVCPVVKAPQEVEVKTPAFSGAFLSFCGGEANWGVARLKVSYQETLPRPPSWSTPLGFGGVRSLVLPFKAGNSCNMKAGPSLTSLQPLCVLQSSKHRDGAMILKIEGMNILTNTTRYHLSFILKPKQLIS